MLAVVRVAELADTQFVGPAARNWGGTYTPAVMPKRRVKNSWGSSAAPRRFNSHNRRATGQPIVGHDLGATLASVSEEIRRTACTKPGLVYHIPVGSDSTPCAVRKRQQPPF